MSFWVNIVHPVGLYVVTVGGVDLCKGEVASFSTNRAYNCHPLPVSIMRCLLVLSLLVEYLIKCSFSLPNDPDHESLLVHIVGISGQNVKFLDLSAQKIKL